MPGTPRDFEDVVVAIDSSISMRAKDYAPSRFDVARTALKRFVEVRLSTCPMDKVGLVAFYEFAVPISDPTTDMKRLTAYSSKLKVLGEATNLGDALLSGIKMLSLTGDSSIFRRKIVVITDGTFNQGPDPAMASLYAASKGVTLDFVTMGRVETADLEIIDQCVSQTKGSHMHATDPQGVFASVTKLADRRSIST
ncbi:MAG: VWA domain-containing protein [Thermoprotei archaeon]